MERVGADRRAAQRSRKEREVEKGVRGSAGGVYVQLHLAAQVTLGNGKSVEKVTLQCNVGNKSPILLCRLTPDVSETCHMELEFEEDDDVVFSVLGQRSVHLSGYFVGLGRDTGGNDTDSYGEDIAHSDSDDSNFYASISEDEYESDFIDDDDIDMLPESPRRKSGDHSSPSLIAMPSSMVAISSSTL